MRAKSSISDSEMLPGVNVYSPICATGVTSAAVPVMKHSVNVDSSSGLMCR